MMSKSLIFHDHHVELTRYTDPDRLHLARAAAVYLGKSDVDNVRRPISIMKKRHALAIFRGESCRFHFKASKVVYDHLITYTTADMRACAGLRANKPAKFIPPAEDADPIYNSLADSAFDNYNFLVDGIDPATRDKQKRKRLQAARSILPMSVELEFEFQFNFLTLINIFQQRLWTPGAQLDTHRVVSSMWRLVRDCDPELWDAVADMFGPEEIAWQHARDSIRKKDPALYNLILQAHGKIDTMWN